MNPGNIIRLLGFLAADVLLCQLQKEMFASLPFRFTERKL